MYLNRKEYRALLSFYSYYPDKFCEEIFNVKLRLYQKVFIRLMSRGKNMTKQYKHYTNITREILDSIDIGDLIKINDWKKPMIVEAVSDNYFLMIQERNGHTYYSVCSKLAWNGIKYNAMVGGMFHCGTDNWIFGTPLCLKYENVYEFDNPYITRLYLKEFEEGKAHISERNGIPIYDLYVKKLHEF